MDGLETLNPAAPVETDTAPDAFPDPVADAARRVFRVPALYPYQRLVVANILDSIAAGPVPEDEFDETLPTGMSALPPEARPMDRTSSQSESGALDAPNRQVVILPTGAGKSLCFQLPATLLPGVTVVVYPLLSLMGDQQRRLAEVGVHCGVLRGGQGKSLRRELLRHVVSGETRVVLTNPETLSSASVLEDLKRCTVSHLVIDEAHCVCEWGETFRPSYLELGRCIDELSPAAVTAFTATASDDILSGIRRHLFPGGCHLIRGNPDRSNIAYHVQPVLSASHALVAMLSPSLSLSPLPSPTADWSAAEGLEPRLLAGDELVPHLPQWRYGMPVRLPAIVFCRSRTETELTAALLRRRLPAADVYFYHAGLENSEKQQIERWFYDSDSGILVATCAYGMGVDKKNVRTVIHLGMPPSVESYLQEAGRAGRDGNPSNAILLASGRSVLSKHAPEPGSLAEARQARMAAYLSADGCRRTYLLQVMGWQEEACFGCDFCFGTRTDDPLEKDPVLGFLRRHRRRFTKDETARLLCGEYSGSDWIAPRRPPLLGWKRSDVLEAMALLESAGDVQSIRKGPWAGRLTVRSSRRQQRRAAVESNSPSSR